MEKPNRQSIRLRSHDYSGSGMYFITICTHNRECLFGNIAEGEMRLNDAGRLVASVWKGIPDRHSHVDMDEFVVMPDHMHGIIASCRGEPCVRPVIDIRGNPGEHKIRPCGTAPDSVGRIIQAFKSISSNEYACGVVRNGWPPFSRKLWQRNYWERKIRNEAELKAVRQYIRTNPAKWQSGD